MNDLSLSCEQVRDAIASGAQLVDVRSPQEFVQGALHGAINLPVQKLAENLHLIDINRRVLVYCASGQRGQIATRYLQEQGFPKVMNIGAHSNYQAC